MSKTAQRFVLSGPAVGQKVDVNSSCALTQAAGLDILNAFPETVPLWSFHMWDKDCTHYCMPGPYELWTYMLTQKLKKMSFRD